MPLDSSGAMYFVCLFHLIAGDNYFVVFGDGGKRVIHDQFIFSSSLKAYVGVGSLVAPKENEVYLYVPGGGTLAYYYNLQILKLDRGKLREIFRHDFFYFDKEAEKTTVYYLEKSGDRYPFELSVFEGSFFHGEIPKSVDKNDLSRIVKSGKKVIEEYHWNEKNKKYSSKK
jgi:hypothetical protein